MPRSCTGLVPSPFVGSGWPLGVGGGKTRNIPLLKQRIFLFNLAPRPQTAVVDAGVRALHFQVIFGEMRNIGVRKPVFALSFGQLLREQRLGEVNAFLVGRNAEIEAPRRAFDAAHAAGAGDFDVTLREIFLQNRGGKGDLHQFGFDEGFLGELGNGGHKKPEKAPREGLGAFLF